MKNAIILISVSALSGAFYNQSGLPLPVVLMPLVGLVFLDLAPPAPPREETIDPRLIEMELKLQAQRVKENEQFKLSLLSMGLIFDLYIVVLSVAGIGIKDDTTFAIMAPGAVLIGMLFGGWMEKQGAFLPQRVALWTTGSLLCVLSFKYLCMANFWIDSSVYDTDDISQANAFVMSLSINSVSSVLVILPILLSLDWFLLRRSPFAPVNRGLSSLGTCLLFIAMVSPLMPMCWNPLFGEWYSSTCNFNQFVARDSLRLLLALSSIPASFAGLIIWMSGWNFERLRNWRAALICASITVIPLLGTAYLIQNNLANCYYSFGSFYACLGQYTNALGWFDKALSLSPNWGYVHSERAIVYAKQREFRKSAEDMTKAINLGSYSPFYSFMFRLNDAKEYSSIVSLSTNIMKLSEPGTIAFEIALRRRGRAFANLGDEKSAIADMNTLILYEPDPVSYVGRAFVYERFGKYQLAIEDCSRAIKMDSNYAEAYSIRARALLGLQEYLQALGSCDRSIQLDPYFGRIYFTRSQILEKLGMREAAKKELEKAAELGYESNDRGCPHS